MQEIYSFSVKRLDSSGTKVIKQVKDICATKGVSFSFVILTALKEYLPILEKKYD
jgi:hypothetical protein